MAARNILIGGGTGFIGKNLGELLIANGYNVMNVARMPGTSNISWSKLELSGLPTRTCAVINLAGQQFMDFTKSWTPGFKQNVQNSRIYTTKALAKAINQSKDKPKVFVLVTGVGAYEPSERNKYDESSPTTGIDFFSRLTVEWEKAACVDPPVRLVIIRSGVVLGRWGGMIKNMFVPFYLGFGGRIGSGKQYLPWIHIDDLTGLIKFAVENDNVQGVLNGVSPKVITNEEFTQESNSIIPGHSITLIPAGIYNPYGLSGTRCARASKQLNTIQFSFAKALRRPAFLPVPESVLNFLLNSERAMLMTKGQYVIPKRVLEYGFKYRYENIEDACQEFAHLCPKKHPLK